MIMKREVLPPRRQWHPFDLIAISAILSFLVVEAACVTAPASASVHTSSLTANCTPAADLGILPGQDNRAAFNAIAASSCVQLGAGTYELATPNDAHMRTVWTMAPDVELVGAGQALTTLTFSGHTAQYDWRGIQGAPGAWIHGLTIDTTALVVDVAGDQRHAVRWDGNGSTHPILVDHVTCKHFAGGDCFQFVGYDNATPDRRLWNVTIHDVDCTSHRSCIAVHSGLHTFEIYNLVGRAWDQVFDFEGSGDIFDGNIHDNTVLVADGQQSSIGADLNALTRLHFHHNKMDLGIQVYYCWDCEIDHNTITQTVPNNAATVSVIAGDGIYFHDETWKRNANMINGPVFSAVQHGSVPIRRLRFADVVATNDMSWTGLNFVGVQGADLYHVTLSLTGQGPARIGLNVENLKSGSTVLTQSSDISVSYSKFTSAVAFYAPITVGAGVGAVTVQNTTVVNSTRGMVCGAGAGPITYYDNTMLAPQCGVLGP